MNIMPKKLSSFYMNYLIKLLKITWQKRSQTQRSSLKLIYQAFTHCLGECKSGGQITSFKWLTHTSPRHCFTVNWLKESAHKVDKKKHYKDTLKTSLKSFEINFPTSGKYKWKTTWKRCNIRGATSYKQNRIAGAQRKCKPSKFKATPCLQF